MLKATLEGILSRNWYLVFFIYGLAFFLMGFSIALQARRPSTFRLGQHLRLLAGFGLLHGAAEWAYIFLSPNLVAEGWKTLRGAVLNGGHAILIATSFAFLLAFDGSLLTSTWGWSRGWQRVPFLLLGIWLWIFISYRPSDLAQWLEAGLHKISDPKWMEGGVALKGFWAKAVGALPNTQPAIKYGWYKAFIQGLLDGEHYTWFAKLVVFGEILTGIALILGVVTVFALLVGAFMNLNFMLAGTASTNPVLYTVSILLLLAGPAAYLYGLDRYLLPYLRQFRNRREAAAN